MVLTFNKGCESSRAAVLADGCEYGNHAGLK
jgi:hypothetical protein